MVRCGGAHAIADIRQILWYPKAVASEPPEPRTADAGRFELTHWSLIADAGDRDSAKARKALERLCAAHWYPLYAFVRRAGHSAHDAQDLTREFFARLAGKNWLDAVDREKGKFRSFLFVAMKHFLGEDRRLWP